MKKIKRVLAVFFVLLVMARLSMVVTYPNEYKVIKTLGKISRVTTEPGLTFHIPVVQSVTKILKSSRLYDIAPTEIYTSDKKKMEVDAYIVWRVTDPIKFTQQLNASRTSAEGIALIPATPAMKACPEGLRIHINAGEGHENDCFVEPAELALADTAPAGTIEAPAPQAAPAQAAPAAQAASQHAGQPAGQALAGISHEELAKLIESSVERRVAPLRAMLAAEAERGPGMTEILGGIGWILGIFGTAALCLSRRGR